MNFTVDQLVTDTLAIDNTPLSQQTFTNEQIVKYLDEEMRGAVIPLFTKAREEYFVHTWSFPVDSSFKGFTIPSQTAGFRLRDIYIFDTSGNFQSKLIRINPDQIPYMRGFQYLPSYYVENNEIIMYPALNQSGIMKVRYFKAPNHLTPILDAGGQVTGKLPGNVLQLDNVPTSWTTFSGPKAITIDATTSESPFNFLEYAQGAAKTGPIIKVAVTTANPTTAQVTIADNDAYAAISVGDYIWENDKCGFVQFLPFEALQLIKLRASMRILKAQGDLQNLSVTAQLYNAAADDVMNLISPKIENQIKRIWNTAGLLGRRYYIR